MEINGNKLFIHVYTIMNDYSHNIELWRLSKSFIFISVRNSKKVII